MAKSRTPECRIGFHAAMLTKTGMSEQMFKKRKTEKKKRYQLYTTQGRERVIKKYTATRIVTNRIVSRQVRNRLHDTHRCWNDYTSYSVEGEREERVSTGEHTQTTTFSLSLDFFWRHLNLHRRNPQILQWL